MVEVYTEESLFKALNQKELKELADKFKEYKKNKAGNILGVNLGNPYFGKDEALTYPPEIRNILYKIHFKPDSPKPAVKKWHSHIQRGHIPTSDHIIIYCKGNKNINFYLLIDLFKPDGHKRMKDINNLIELKINFADPFMAQY